MLHLIKKSLRFLIVKSFERPSVWFWLREFKDFPKKSMDLDVATLILAVLVIFVVLDATDWSTLGLFGS